MGAHGPEIFDDDVAADVKGTFRRAMAESDDLGTATRAVLDEYAEYLDDEDDECKVVLALAALQLDYGAVEPWIRARAIEIVERGEDRERWFAETWLERERLLRLFRDQLLDADSRPHRRSAESERRAAMAAPGLPPGAWHPGIGGSDVGLDVFAAFDNALLRGMDDQQTVDHVLSTFADDLADPATAADVYLTLAQAFLNPYVDRRLPPPLRERALAIIESGDATRAWEPCGESLLHERRRALDRLRGELIEAGAKP